MKLTPFNFVLVMSIDREIKKFPTREQQKTSSLGLPRRQNLIGLVTMYTYITVGEMLLILD